MNVHLAEIPPTQSRSQRLKSATSGTHDRLDQAIMAAEPFAGLERYVLFLKVQHAFHRDIDTLYDDPQLDVMLPDLQGRRRLRLVESDLSDLDAKALLYDAAPAFPSGAPFDLPAALGWLYVAEGSNLGAAFLLKLARGLGLSETFGAAHLSGAPGGRGLHWRTFTEALNAVSMSQPEESRMVTGAEAAFRRVRDLADKVLDPRR